MRREEIKAIFGDATDEQINKILNINGADIEKVKGKLTEFETRLGEKNTALEKLSADFEKFKTNNATAEDYKAKYEAFKKEVAEKEAQAETARKEKEKADVIASRFETVVGEKKFIHDAIKADYLKKFGEALESKDFEGKSDVEIFHVLTKDDGAAFENVTAFKLEGGKPASGTEGKVEIPKIF